MIKLLFAKLWMVDKQTPSECDGVTSNKEAILKSMAAAWLYGPSQLLEGEQGCSGSSAPAACSTGLCALKVQVKLDLQSHLGQWTSAGRAERDLDRVMGGGGKGWRVPLVLQKCILFCF